MIYNSKYSWYNNNCRNLVSLEKYLARLWDNIRIIVSEIIIGNWYQRNPKPLGSNRTDSWKLTILVKCSANWGRLFVKSTHLWALGLKCTSPSEWNYCKSLSPHIEPMQKFLRLRRGCYLFEANGSALTAHCSSISHSISQTLKSLLLMSRNYPYNFSQYATKTGATNLLRIFSHVSFILIYGRNRYCWQ